MPVTQPSVYPVTTSGREFVWAREKTTWGTDDAVGVMDAIHEDIMGVDESPQRETWDETSETGTTADIQGQYETTHYEQFTVRLSAHANGGGGAWPAIMMGPVTYTPPVSAPGLHTIPVHPTSNLLNTLTCWYKVTSEQPSGNSAAALAIKKMNASSLTQLHYTFTQNADLALEAQFSSLWPSNVGALPAPTAPTVYIGGADGVAEGGTATTRGVGTPLLSTGGTFTLIGSSGTAYTTRVLSGDFTLSRPIDPAFDSTQHNPFYLKLGKLTFEGNLVVVFEGYGTATVEEDFRNFKAVGTSLLPMKLRWTDPNGLYLEFVSWPWHWTAFTLDHSGQWIKANLSFRAGNDKASVNQATPVLTNVKLNVNNNWTTVMTGP